MIIVRVIDLIGALPGDLVCELCQEERPAAHLGPGKKEHQFLYLLHQLFSAYRFSLGGPGQRGRYFSINSTISMLGMIIKQIRFEKYVDCLRGEIILARFFFRISIQRSMSSTR